MKPGEMGDESYDVLLRDYLAAGEEAEVELHLVRILDDLAKPIIRRIVGSVYRGSAGDLDVEDVVSDTLAHLLRRLRNLRGDPSHPIQDLRAYIVTCAYNSCHERLRERYPARNRLRNHLQYLFSHHARLALWRTARGGMVCGFREWAGADPVSDHRAERVSLAARSDSTAEDRVQIGSLVTVVLRELGGPLELDMLVTTIGRLIQLEQRLEVPLSSTVLSSSTAADTALEQRLSLRQLWEDVGQLSHKQRAALLLNLRDAHGRECLSLLPLTRTASIAEIAAAVRMPLSTFAAVWNELPLSDAAIGVLLNATSRQVIKLRRLARERLRRIAKKRAHPNLGAHSDSTSTDLAIAPRGRTAR